jgi:thiamine biosynthesis lipoprotein
MGPEAVVAHQPAGMVEHRFRSMGCEVTLLAPSSRPDAEPLTREVFARWDERFSRFRAGSELEALNNAGGRPFPVSELMLTVLGAALRAARATDGLFDPLLGVRMVELGYDRTFEELPSRRTAGPLLDWRAGAWREIVVDEERRTVQLPIGYRIDLGGIAKGMAVDAAIEALVAESVPYAAVDAGGDLAVAGLPPGLESWPVAIDNGPGETVVAVRQGALATSSVLRRRWEVNDAERHHLLDPRTGLPATGAIVQASVAAARCRQAEVAAKVAILSDLPGAIGRLEQHRLAALLVMSSGEAWRVGSWH